ncbi:MAG: hypothetical protein SF123_00835 [Chloroflexota bacterium]|nr:hypothetical protein [Chloroflexota bacterium]
MELPSRLQAHIETNPQQWAALLWHNVPLLIGLLIGIIIALTYW